MRRLFGFLFLGLILLPIALAGAVLLSIESQPRVNRAVDLGPERMARGQRLFDDNDPRKLKPGERRTVQLAEADLDLAANYLAHRYAHGSARLALAGNGAEVELSVPLPGPLAGRYLNGQATLLPATAGLPRFESLRVGRLAVPGWLADRLAQAAVAHFNGEEATALIADVVKQASIGGGQLTLVYEWQKDLPTRLSGAILPPAELERLKVYRQRLIDIGQKAKQGISLADVLQPLLKTAGERSAGGDPVAENRAAIAALTFYVNQRGLDALVPGAEPWPKAAARKTKLNGREDFPKHFIISAALAATADSPLSDAIGLYKEVKDSRGGSGFSFNDLAADRAGTRLGEMAVASADAARHLQQRVETGLREADFMPATADLPEFMPEAEFKRRFGGIGEPAYVRMTAEIERRVATLPLYRR
jgi:hypothetical protein